VGQRIQLIANKCVVDLRVVGIVRELSTPAAAYVTPETFAQSIAQSGAGPGQTNGLRIGFDDAETNTQDNIVRNIEQTLSQNKVNVKISISEAMLATAVDGHSLILIIMLLVMALIMAVVGLLGLASAIGTSVTE